MKQVEKFEGINVSLRTCVVISYEDHSAKHIRLKGSLEDVSNGKPKMEVVETRTNQTEPKNRNLKDS
ncbi:hypothetical protein JHK87_024486 [Glycine soja]|nr:hypothetical protein JHK87_024486 [Glycine soja]